MIKQYIWLLMTEMKAAYYNSGIEYIRYLLSAKHRKGHGIHSPSAFELINKVIFDKGYRDEYRKVECVFDELKKDNEEIIFEEIGAGSRYFKAGTRKRSDIVKRAGVSKKFGRLLFRIINHYKPHSVIELGTSLGLSTSYMGIANSNTRIKTIEGNESVLEVARGNVLQLGLNNIDFHLGLFNDKLPGVLKEALPLEFAFVDGNHTYDGTMAHYFLLREHMVKGLIVFDDIYWSFEMKKAWHEIVKKEIVTIDLFQFGIVMVGELLTPGNYRVSF